MNLVRQRELLKAARDLRILTTEGLHAALHAPVFIFGESRERTRSADEVAWIEKNICSFNGTLAFAWAPYPVFRLVQQESWIIAFMSEEATRALLWLSGDKLPAAKFRFGSKEGHGCADFWLFDEHGKEVSREQLEKRVLPEEAEMFAQQAHANICEFLLTLSTRSATTVRVRDNKPGKSPEWHLAREHYLLLPKTQALRLSKARRGISARDLQLAAHWRRAHFRRLMSEKFTHKRHEVVPVKQAWVGPREWIGLDSKIYKVME